MIKLILRQLLESSDDLSGFIFFGKCKDGRCFNRTVSLSDEEQASITESWDKRLKKSLSSELPPANKQDGL